ncbi:MAG: ROK family protein [Synergistaceae bacterium]
MFIGIDLGGHTISFALIDFDDYSVNIIEMVSVDTPKSRDIGDVVSLISEKIKYYCSKYSVLSVGIAVPAFLNRERTIILKFTNFLSLENVNLVELLKVSLLKSNISLPIYIENDANCAAIGEMYSGKAKEMNNFIVITLGTGVGSGIVVNGKLLIGSHGIGGELGHIAVVSGDTKCACGGYSHLETSFSADALEKKAKELFLAKDFKELWDKRDLDEVKNILNPALDSLGRAVASLYALFDPEIIILTGGVSRADKLIDLLSPIIDNYIASPYKNHANITTSDMNENDAVIGAASLCFLNK